MASALSKREIYALEPDELFVEVFGENYLTNPAYLRFAKQIYEGRDVASVYADLREILLRRKKRGESEQKPLQLDCASL